MRLEIIKSFYKVSFILLVILCFWYLILSRNIDRMYSSKMTPSNTTTTKTFMVPFTLMSRYRTSNRDFQLVSNGNRTYVYSAYLEKRSKKIRVMGITEKITASLHCVLWYMIGTNVVSSRFVTGYVVKLPEAHDRRYTATNILCYLIGKEIPDAVSIVETHRDVKPSNILPVRRLETLKTKHNFTVCVSPIHRDYGNTKELIEWLEMIKLQGITNVLIYVQNTTNDVISVLKYYQGDGLVRMFPWTLPSVWCRQKLKELHYCGQLVALHDCIYRSKGQSRFMTSFDFDELIIPQMDKDYTWMDMLNRLPKESVYIFRSSFFYPSENTTKPIADTQGMLRTMTHQYKDDFIFGARDRSKWIVRNEQAITMGIHQPWAITSGEEYSVPPHIGLLHHYRTKSIPYPSGITVSRQQHNAAEKYRKQLEYRVDHAFRKLKIKF